REEEGQVSGADEQSRLRVEHFPPERNMRVGRDDLPGTIRHGCNLLGIFVGCEELNPQIVVFGRYYDGAEFTINLDLFDAAAIRPIQHFEAPIRICDPRCSIPPFPLGCAELETGT